MKNYSETNPNINAYLLTRKDIKFERTRPVGDKLYFEYSPYEVAAKAASLYQVNKADPVDPKELLDQRKEVLTLVFKWKSETGNTFRGGNYR